MAASEKPWLSRDPKAKTKARWRVVIECYTEYSTVVEASSADDANAQAVKLFGEEEMYHGERWEHLGDLYRVKAMGRAASRGAEPPGAEFLGPEKEYPEEPKATAKRPSQGRRPGKRVQPTE